MILYSSSAIHTLLPQATSSTSPLKTRRDGKAGDRHKVEFSGRDLGVAVRGAKGELYHVGAKDAQQVMEVNGRRVRAGLDQINVVFYKVPRSVLSTEVLRHTGDQTMGLLVGGHSLSQQT